MAPGRHEIKSETEHGVMRYTFNGNPAGDAFDSLRAVRAWCAKIKTGDGGFSGDTIGLRKLAKLVEQMAVDEVKRGNLKL